MVKIRVILLSIISLLCFQSAIQKQAIKDQTLYYLAAIYIGKQKNTLARDRGHIIFNTKTKTASCFTSCNFIQLKYALKGNNFKFTSINPGKDPCPDRTIGLEEDFKENLPKVSNYLLNNRQLILLNKKDTLMIFYEPITQ